MAANGHQIVAEPTDRLRSPLLTMNTKVLKIGSNQPYAAFESDTATSVYLRLAEVGVEQPSTISPMVQHGMLGLALGSFRDSTCSTCSAKYMSLLADFAR